MAIGDPISATIPAVGTPGTAYAENINALLEQVKALLEAKVPLSSLLAGEFDLANNNLVNVGSLGLYNKPGAPTSPVNTFQAFGGEVYWVSPSGAVRLTSGGSLDASSIAGITGDYGGSNPAQFRFNDSDKIFAAYDDYAAGEWAYIRALGFDVMGGSTSANRVRILWGGTSSYALTLPAAPPAAQSVVQMDASGNMVVSNELAPNQDFKISGSAQYCHDDTVMTKLIRVNDFYAANGATAMSSVVGSITRYFVRLANNVYAMGLDCFKPGDRIKSFIVHGARSVAGSITYRFEHTNPGTAVNVNETLTKVGDMFTDGEDEYTLNSPYTVAVGDQITLSISNTGLSGNSDLRQVQITFDHPI